MLTWNKKLDFDTAQKPCPPQANYHYKTKDSNNKTLLCWGYNLPDILYGLEHTVTIDSLPKKYQIVLLDLPYRKDKNLIEEPRPNSEDSTCFFGPNYLAGQPSETFFEGSLVGYFNLLNQVISLTLDFLSESGFLIIKYIGRARHQLKILVDNLFGPNNFVNEIYLTSPFAQKIKTEDANASIKEVFSILLVYSKSEKPKIVPDYKDKKSGGYWHTMHSKGQGPARIFRLNGKEHTIEPPVGRHWTFKQEKIDLMCTTPHPIEPNTFLIKLNSEGQPVYWILEKEGHILDNIWFDIESHVRTDFGWDLDSSIYDRIFTSFSETNDPILHIFCGSGMAAESAMELNRKYVGIDPRPLAIALTRDKILEKKQDLSIYSYGVYQDDIIEKVDCGDFRMFVLKCIDAQALSNTKFFNGFLKAALIYVSKFNHTFTVQELEECLSEYSEMKQVFPEVFLISKTFLKDEQWIEFWNKKTKLLEKARTISFEKLGKEFGLNLRFVENPIAEIEIKPEKDHISVNIQDFYFMNRDQFDLQAHPYLTKNTFWNSIDHWFIEIFNSQHELIFYKLLQREDPFANLPISIEIEKKLIAEKNVLRIEICDISGGIYLYEKNG